VFTFFLLPFCKKDKVEFLNKVKDPSNKMDGDNVNAIGANNVSGGSTVSRVTVPDNVQPGEEFQVYTGTRIVRVRCSMDSRPGQSLQITVPAEPQHQQQQQQQQQSAATRDNQDNMSSSTDVRSSMPLPPDSPNVRRIEGTDPPAYMVDIPHGTEVGEQFTITVQGQNLLVTCPPNARPGQSVRIDPPPPPTDVTRRPTSDSFDDRQNPRRQNREEKTQLFEVEVPNGVQPGAPFALLAGGARVSVTCPANAGPGMRIRFKLPLALTQKRNTTEDSALTKIKLKYDQDGWMRTVRATDLKFQWIRMDEKGDIDLNKRFNFDKSAYVRCLEFRRGDDPRIRTGILSLVPATESVVDSKIKTPAGKEVVTYSQLAEAQAKAFDEKADWFQATCAKLGVEWNEGHMRLNVRREFLLGDSVGAIMSLSRKDLRKVWRFKFIGEQCIDAGGLAREWFELVCRDIFDPDMGLWQRSKTNQMSMTINPASGMLSENLQFCGSAINYFTSSH
jgi:hypothetical protein